ncbi:TonB-dependent receptor [Parapedobacter tibetensis]|uniref:TonB-dependent receptor n=1 Tax=Parapedobacter tibetensis TaxID=2972951 RepID=UPI00214D8FEE|nr:TonB-dependent receptor [Parapedobacter tibetensis]
MNLNSKAGGLWKPRVLKKSLAVLLLQLLCTPGLFAQAVKQEKTISLNYKEISASPLFKVLKEQTGYDFNFSPAEVDQAKIGPLDYKNVPLDKVLSDLGQYGLSFHQAGNIISVSYQKPPSKNPNVQAGQEKGSGTLKGRIVEFETSQPLPGASVLIVKLKKGAQSDENGYYHLTGIPAGKYTLQVSFVSYTTESVSVSVRAASESTYDVRLQGDNTLGEVVINAIGKTRRPVAHTSERQLISEIKNLNVVASGISSEQISKSADRNAAQAVQRVAGVSIVDDKFVIVRGLNPRYNLTYLNDNVAPSTEMNNRNFALDLLPSRIIDKILVYKSPSPENQADATGGVIKIYTKDAKAVKHFDIEFQLGHRPGTSFNNDFLAYNGGKFDFLGFDDGTRALPSVLPSYGSLLLADLKPSEYAEAFNSTLYYGKKTALPNMQVTANYYNAFRLFDRTLSSLTSFSYKNDNQKYDQYRQEGTRGRSVGSTDRTGTDDRNTNTAQLNLLQNFTLSLNERHKLFFKNFLLQQGLDATVVRVSHPTFQDAQSADRNKDITLSYSQRFLYAGNLGGNHTFGKDSHRLEWNAGYTYSQQETPDQRVIRLRGMIPEIAMGDADIQWWARGYSPNSSEDLNTIPLSLGIISRLWSRNNEGIYNGALDYTYKPATWAVINVGTFQQWKKRTLSRRIYTLHGGNVDPARSGLDARNSHQWVDANLVRFRESQLPDVWSSNYLNDDYTGLYVADRTTGSDMYVGTEQNNAGYVALTLTPYPWIEVHGGVRYEYNRQKIGAAIPSESRLSIPVSQPILTDHIDSEWLPSVNIAYKPSDQWVVRAAYGKTVNRTEFREVSPFRELDFENNTQLSGNPSLVSAKAENYDFRVEFYPDMDKGDAISVGAFYKEITDPIERVNNSNRVVGMFPSISFDNATSATLRGLEVEVRKSLFRNLSVIANGSIINSEVRYEDLSQTSVMIGERPLQGQAPYLLNAGLYYDNAGWGTRIAAIYNYVAENIYAVGLGDRSNPLIVGSENRGSLLELPRQLLDFSATQRIGDGLQLKFTVQNLLDRQIEVAEDWNRSNQYEPLVELPSAQGALPVNEGDNIASSYRPGRYFNLALSYSF